MNGQMSEARNGEADLKDIDEGTFVRFIEWAHRGYYTAAEFTRVEMEEQPHESEIQDHVEIEAPPQEVLQSSWDQTPAPAEEDALASSPPPDIEPDQPLQFGRPHKKGKKSKDFGYWGMQVEHSEYDATPRNKRELKEAFIRRKPTVRQDALQVPPPLPNQSSEEDYTDVFLSHARLYVFADKYDIQALKDLALDELHATLKIYDLYPTRTGDITELLRYAYANSSDSPEGVEDLRTLIMQYVSYEMDTLIDDEGFKDLMIENGGPLLGDFLRMVGRRIS